MRKCFLPLVLLFLMLGVTACNAEQKCPVEVELLRNPAVPALAVAKVSAVTDSVIITAISANRGNTKVDDYGRFPLPQTVNFGNYIYAGIYTSVGSVKEIEVQRTKATGRSIFSVVNERACH